VATKAKKSATKIRESNEKAPAKPDKVTGTYNGKKVYTGPRGGRYYINSNGNKTYLSDDQ
jgi:colicin import membrane protein